MGRRCLLALAALAAPAALSSPALAGPVELPTGRSAAPAGRITTLRAFPTGVAVSPDGKTILAIAGPPIQGGASTSAPDPLPSPNAGVSLMVIDAATGAVRQNLQLDDAFQGVTFSPDGAHAYVAGGSRQNVYALDVNAAGAVTRTTPYAVGALVSAIALTPDGTGMWIAEPEANRVQRLDVATMTATQTVAVPSPNRVAVAPKGGTVYATNWRGSAVSAIDTSTGAVRSLATGLHPTDVAVTPAGRLLVVDADDASLATFEPGKTRAAYTDLAQLARRGDSPNAIALGPDGRVYVSLAADDAVAVLEPSSDSGTSQPPPAGVALPNGRLATPAGIVPAPESGGGAPRGSPVARCRRGAVRGRRGRGRGRPGTVRGRRGAVRGRRGRGACRRRRGRHNLQSRGRRGASLRHRSLRRRRHGRARARLRGGRPRARRPLSVPFRGAAPARSDARAAARSPRGGRHDAAPRGWRVTGLIPTGWYPDALAISPDGQTLYTVTARGLGHSAAATSPFVDPDPVSAVVDGAYATAGTLEAIRLPDPAGLTRLSAEAQATYADRTPTPSASNPVLAGPRGPLKHVIYITRENKTYDSILGDLHPGQPGNAFVLFGRDVTPNMHALQTQFSEADNFSYEGFASVVGHMWEDTGTVSDVFERAVASNTGAHTEHANDSWHEPSNYPPTGLITQQAWLAGRSVRTYNQELAQQSGLLPVALQAPTSRFPNYNLAVADTKREAGWEAEFRQFADHRCEGDLAATYGARCSLPEFEYVYLGEDHTTVVDQPGYPTIQAQVADNDYATARIIDAVSHSEYWKSTVVIVVEDDPQGTGDSRSAYRGLLGIASPYVKRGAISHTHYSLTSAVGAIDHILGLPPISDYSLTNRPLDDLFTSAPDYTPFAADDSGVRRYPFVALPALKAPAASDPAHGILSFTEPDRTVPSVAAAAQWRALKGTPAPP